MLKPTLIVAGAVAAGAWLFSSPPKEPTYMGRDGAYEVFCKEVGDDVDCWREPAKPASKDFRGLDTKR
jgi:hypothetical protein